jgi:hypothetical protein
MKITTKEKLLDNLFNDNNDYQELRAWSGTTTKNYTLYQLHHNYQE